MGKRFDLLQRLHQSKVARWPNVGPPQCRQQVDIRRPRPDTPDADEGAMGCFVVKVLHRV